MFCVPDCFVHCWECVLYYECIFCASESVFLECFLSFGVCFVCQWKQVLYVIESVFSVSVRVYFLCQCLLVRVCFQFVRMCFIVSENVFCMLIKVLYIDKREFFVLLTVCFPLLRVCFVCWWECVMYDGDIVFYMSVRMWGYFSVKVGFCAGEGMFCVSMGVFWMTVKVFFFMSLRVCFVCQYHCGFVSMSVLCVCWWECVLYISESVYGCWWECVMCASVFSVVMKVFWSRRDWILYFNEIEFCMSVRVFCRFGRWVF